MTSRPVLSIVVPVYNVATYLAECIDSIRSQSVTDLEIVAVDDGSTDSSGAILAGLADVDPRLRIVTQANAGLGAARNAGVDAARGEFLWFVDSDDRLAPGAVAVLLRTITTTGSDLATGNVVRLVGDRTEPARFLAETFTRTRLRTHVSRFPALLADRVAWNKIFRRSFWDRYEFRFPEGVHYEDSYVTIPAHHLARQVDVRREPVYQWRVRDDEVASITQQRADPQSMRDRVAAVRYISDFLARRGLDEQKRRYDTSAVTHDLRYFLEVVADERPGYVDAFLDAANDYLVGVSASAFADLPAIRRLEWEMVRRHDATRLIELVRFERDELSSTRAHRRGRHWYAEFPGHDDASLRLDARSFEVRRELELTSTIDDLAVSADSVSISGHAAVELVGPVARSLRAVAVPDAAGVPLTLHTELDGKGGFTATLPLSSLLRGRRHERSWRVGLLCTDQGLRRFAAWHRGTGGRSASRVVLDRAGTSVEVRLDLTGRGRLTMSVSSRLPVLTSAVVDELGVLEVTGNVPPGTTADALVAGDRDLPVHVEDGEFLARIPNNPNDSIASGDVASRRLELIVGGVRRGLVLGSDANPPITVVGVDDDGYATIQ